MRMLEGEREFSGKEGHRQEAQTSTQNTQIQGTWPSGGGQPLSPLLVGACYQMSAPGKHVTPVKVDMPRLLLGNRPTQPPEAGSGKSPTQFLIGTSTLFILQGSVCTWADSQECARAHTPCPGTGTGRGHVGVRGFQGASGQTLCVLIMPPALLIQRLNTGSFPDKEAA